MIAGCVLLKLINKILPRLIEVLHEKQYMTKGGISLKQKLLRATVPPDTVLSRHFRKLLEIAFEKLFTKDVPMADIHILPQGGKSLRKRQMVSTLNPDDTLFIEYRPHGGKSESYNTKKRRAIKEEEINAVDEKLKKIIEFKDSMKRLSDNEQDVKPVLNEIKTRLNINEILTNKKDTLAHLEKLEQEMRALKFQLMEIDFNSIDVKKRCLELLKVKGIHGLNYCIKTPIVQQMLVQRPINFQVNKNMLKVKKLAFQLRRRGLGVPRAARVLVMELLAWLPQNTLINGTQTKRQMLVHPKKSFLQ